MSAQNERATGNDDTSACPRCGRVTRVFDLTATSVTCPSCDPAWRTGAFISCARRRTDGDGDATIGRRFDVRITSDRNSTVVSICGDFDAAVADEVRTVLTALIKGGRYRVCIDASGVSLLDSTALGVLVGARKRAEAHPGGSLHLDVPSTAVRTVLAVTGLTGLVGERRRRDRAIGPAAG